MDGMDGRKAYKITDHGTGAVACVEPVCYEDCMNPGQVKTIPLTKEETADQILLSDGRRTWKVERARLQNGEVELTEYEFTPVLPHYEAKRCSPCTGCGACSW